MATIGFLASNRNVVFCVCMLFVCSGLACAQTDDVFLIKDGDRVTIHGDSITDDYGAPAEQLGYARIIEDFISTRYPHWNVEVFNRGWGGDTAETVGRFARDCISLKPTINLTCMGMNDAYYQPFKIDRYRRYIHALNILSRMTREIDCRMVFVSPPAFDVPQLGPTAKMYHPVLKQHYDMTGYPQILREFSMGMIATAHINGDRYVDMNKLYCAVLAEGRQKYGPEFVMGTRGDPVHPGGQGQLAIAIIILKSLGAPSSVAELEIDAKSGAVVKAENTNISDLTAADASIQFTRLDASLPLPMYKDCQQVNTLMDIAGTINANIIRFRNLPPGQYALAIDGCDIASKSSDAWAEGVNLAQFDNTPEMKHAAEVSRATVEVNQARYHKWRKILCKGLSMGECANFRPYDTSDTKALAEVEKRIADALANRRQVCQPTRHIYTLNRIK